MKYKFRDDLNLLNHDREGVFIELDKDTSLLDQHIMVEFIYRPQHVDVNQFNDATNGILEHVRRYRSIKTLLTQTYIRIPRYAPEAL